MIRRLFNFSLEFWRIRFGRKWMYLNNPVIIPPPDLPNIKAVEERSTWTIIHVFDLTDKK